MKKLLLIILTMTIMSSCSTYNYQSKNQSKVMSKFQKKKHGKYVSARKRGHVNHPAVRKSTRRELIQKINAQRTTIN